MDKILARIFLGVVIFTVLDVAAHDLAKYPDRMKYGNEPGSGFVALYKCGRE